MSQGPLSLPTRATRRGLFLLIVVTGLGAPAAPSSGAAACVMPANARPIITNLDARIWVSRSIRRTQHLTTWTGCWRATGRHTTLLRVPDATSDDETAVNADEFVMAGRFVAFAIKSYDKYDAFPAEVEVRSLTTGAVRARGTPDLATSSRAFVVTNSGAAAGIADDPDGHAVVFTLGDSYTSELQIVDRGRVTAIDDLVLDDGELTWRNGEHRHATGLR